MTPGPENPNNSSNSKGNYNNFGNIHQQTLGVILKEVTVYLMQC